MSPENPERVTCVRLTVRGRVQGVGFRAFVLRRARALGLAGVVRNSPDGGVALEAEGTRDALAHLLSAVRTGPPKAEVSGVEEAWSESAPRHHGFHVVERES